MAETKWRVTVDLDLCISSGGCVMRAPEGFDLDIARQSCPRHEVMEASDEVLDAAENCPAEAISIVDAESGVAIFPPAE